MALVDLDLRRPAIGELLRDLGAQPGVTDVALGHSTLLHGTGRGVPQPWRRACSGSNGNGTQTSSGTASSRCWSAARRSPTRASSSTRAALARVLDELEEAFDFVLIDTPPLLSVGDAVALSPRVDAMIVITRLKVVKRARPARAALSSLRTCATVKLGYVATGAELEEGYGDGGYGYYGYGQRSGRPGPRPAKSRSPSVRAAEPKSRKGARRPSRRTTG